MKNIFLYSTIALAAFTISCREMDENISPNNVDPSQISPRQMITAAETGVYAVQSGTMNQLSNVWTNTWAGNHYYFANPFSREFSLAISNNFANGIWNSSYLNAGNLQTIINNGQADGLPLHVAIAKILKAYNMQYIVDFYNDAPYSEAFKGQANLTPKYDKGSEIYKGLVTEINEAIALIDNTTVTSVNEVRSSEDVIFAGDMDSWKLFANNVKLRLLLRQSKVTDATVRSFVDQQLQTFSGSTIADFYTSDVVIQPGYNNGTAAGLNPMYANYGRFTYDDSSINTNGWRLLKASANYAAYVNGTSPNTSGVTDPRGIRQFSAVGGAVSGIVQGSQRDQTKTESQFSWLGWKFNNYASVNGGMDGYLMLGSEANLLLAEAAVTYPSIFTFDAYSRYQAAVQSSFVFYGLTAAQATTYLTNLSAKPYGWAGAPNKIAAIQYQRLVSLANLRSVETYINYLKTGYPETPLAIGAQEANKPYRLIYPLSEYTSNSGNVPNMSNSDAFSKNQFTPFWNQN
ncbi:SusD/RagB family nutrient-binding outer membrane lipoprotein [Chryseobacterium sp. CT-SW4]|uniref:SusD/RagB family nutrient-binding outer membrane lipoprotein n=1 Tax=Chryseobacterium sp. SW-1 TaxID=3157343 RepID=UPI003B022488